MKVIWDINSQHEDCPCCHSTLVSFDGKHIICPSCAAKEIEQLNKQVYDLLGEKRMEYDDKKPRITECQLENGIIVRYDLALDEKDNPAPLSQEWLAQYEYIGEGTIYRVNGVVQDPHYARWLYFYRRVKWADMPLDYAE